jgi:glycopeptide antibiotics resistance protein
MIGRIILFVIGSVLITVGLVGIYQMQTTVDCSKIINKSYNQWCNQISDKQYGNLYALFFNGLGLIIIGLVITVWQSRKNKVKKLVNMNKEGLRT